MISRNNTARQGLCALALAAATVVAPAIFARGAPVANASGNCVINSTNGSSSVSCQPHVVKPKGMPTEMGLTAANDDNAGVFGPAGPAI